MFNSMNTSKTDYYAPYFCEENIWQLGQQLVAQAKGNVAGRYSVLLLSNQARQIPLFKQRLSHSDEAVIWDYHVILYQHWLTPCIYDLDTRLDCPIDFNSYYYQTFPDALHLPEHLSIRVRVIPLATAYLRRFHSDRQHMLDAQGQPQVPFPHWSPITQPVHRRIPLAVYLDMERELNDGSYLCDYTELPKRLACNDAANESCVTMSRYAIG